MCSLGLALGKPSVLAAAVKSAGARGTPVPLPNLLLCAWSPEHALFFPLFIWEAPPGLLIAYQFAVLLFKAPHLMQLPVLSSSL